MESRQYRIMREARGYRVIVTHGFMDTEYIHGGKVWAKQAEARAAAKAHAERTGVKAIIRFLPETEAEFVELVQAKDVRFSRCLGCTATFSAENTRTEAGWRETQISGMCETCFDVLMKEMDDDDDTQG